LNSFREVSRRLKVAERKFGPNVVEKIVFRDLDGLYYGFWGKGVTKEQFDTWAKEQGDEVLISIIRYIEDGE